jgi:hypothetical protein
MNDVFLCEDFRNGKIKLRNNRDLYIRKLTKVGRFTVWIVNGEYVRKNICEDFVNYDGHHHLPFIPKNEFWIANEASPGEERFYIERMIMEIRFMESGMKYRDAAEKAALFEKLERSKSRAAMALAGPKSHREELLQKVRKKLLKTFSGKVNVWLVNGELVRDIFMPDFGGGGHDLVYHYIPFNEIWIDDDIASRERKFIILHEIHERNLMARGMKYPAAHQSATELEDFFRHNPKKLPVAIRRELGRQKKMFRVIKP